MSAIAGRVLQIHKGAYDAATAYSPLDEVLYQGSTYVCKQNSTGNLPTNTTYWQLVAQKGDAGEVTEAELQAAYKVMGEMGAKNFCKRTKETQTVGEVTFTVNSDDSVTATASTATTAVRNFEYSRMTLPAGSYRFTGCPVGGDSSTKYGIDVYNNTAGSRIGWDIGDGVEFSLSSTTSISIAISIRSGYDLSNNSKTFYPMIRLATDTDNTYAPYAMTNKELTESKIDSITKTGSHTIYLIAAAVTPGDGTKPELFIPWTNPSRKSITFDNFVVKMRSNGSWTALAQSSAPTIHAILENGFKININLTTALTANTSYTFYIEGNIVFA